MRNSRPLGPERTARLIGGALIIAALFGFLAFTAWNNENCRQTNNCGHQGPQQKPASRIGENPGGINSPEAATARYTWWLAAFTGCLFVSTTGLWIFTGLLWRSTKRAVEGEAEAIKIAKRTAAAMKTSADAAVNVQLPVFAYDVRVDWNTGDYWINVQIVGPTPIRITSSCLVPQLGGLLPDTKRYPVAAARDLPQQYILREGGSFVVQRARDISHAEWDKVRRRSIVLWIYGYLDYVDFMRRIIREGFCFGADPLPNGEIIWIEWLPGEYVYSEQIGGQGFHNPPSSP